MLSNGLVDDEEDEWSSGTETAEAPVRLPPPPATLDEVLARIGAVKKAVYTLARQCIDDFERAAPWDLLYYPPDDPDALLAMVGGLVVTIKGVPKKIDGLLRKLPAGDTHPENKSGEPAREDIGFLLQGIHRMVAHDIKRLEGILAPVRDRGPAAPPTVDEGQRLCELSADLKGKYASALMGAAASLIGEGQWDGVELEPVLFPEKAEEFRCTRELTVSLSDTILAIRQLPEQVRFAGIVERWRQEARVDQYALADLPTLRGRIGHLLKERSRRALYTGDYHQISRREVLLSQRINEMERLHQSTWVPAASDAPDLSPVYARLVQLTLEMAAVLDANILKSLIGEKTVNGLRGRTAAPKGLPPRPDNRSDDEGLEALVPLLAEDDLRIFLEMLLTAVQRRASLGVRESAPAEKAPPPPPPKALKAPKPPPPPHLPAFTEELPAFTADELLSPLPDDMLAVPPPSAPASPIDPRAAVARIRARLDEIQAPTSSHWNNFRLAQRMLEKHARLPGAMFHSINPFLQEIAAHLVPDLKAIAPYKGLTLEAVLRLETVCHELCDTDPSPTEMVSEVPRKLERIVRFLDALRAVVSTG